MRIRPMPRRSTRPAGAVNRAQRMRNFRPPNLHAPPHAQDRAQISARACAPSPRARPPSRAAR
jgi:hypothetical protein